MAFTYPNIVLSGVAWFLECQGFLKFTINKLDQVKGKLSNVENMA